MPLRIETYTDSNNNPIEVPVLAEKRQIGIKTPTVTLKRVPVNTKPLHIVKVLNKYNKNDTVLEFVEITTGEITQANQFKVDYENRFITFHPSQKGLYVLVDYYASSFVAVTPDEVIAKEGNSGECIQTLREMIDDGQDVLENLSELGKAIDVYKKLNALIENGLVLIPTVEIAEKLQYDLARSVSMGEDLLISINAWLEAFADVVDLEIRVTELERRMNEIAPLSKKI